MIFFKKNKDDHFDLYYKIVNISREESFYSDYEVPDTTDGRFEILLLHLIILIRKLKRESLEHVSQAIVDLMFSSIDLSFREEGVGDLSIPKKMKKVGMVFYGRSTSLDQILEVDDYSTMSNLLVDYFIRNMFSSDDKFKRRADELSQYTIRFEEALKKVSIKDIPSLNLHAIVQQTYPN
tara:strand:+ start:56 stop:595 length:540 start_codon:yes stop_codon:yes gene_type:complete